MLEYRPCGEQGTCRSVENPVNLDVTGDVVPQAGPWQRNPTTIGPFHAFAACNCADSESLACQGQAAMMHIPGGHKEPIPNLRDWYLASIDQLYGSERLPPNTVLHENFELGERDEV